ncbi:MAG: phosphonopyruvate decarboxylase [Nanoarchaeota archaeon]
MISPKSFYDELVRSNIKFFTGVPDSLLKDFCSYVLDHTNIKRHIIAANEGNAIALAAGHYLATRKPGLVYMQNSGIGNAINPLVSLADPEVYGLPMLLLIGWRGEPGTKDEPQHIKQGKITLNLLDSLNIPYEIFSDSTKNFKKNLETAIDMMYKKNTPYALVIKKGTFQHYELQNKVKTNYCLSREDAIKLVVDGLTSKDVLVSTTGMTSRELFEYRENSKQGHNKDFLTVGSMGHSSQIALGIALSKPKQNVYCLDGDGALIMHMGALAIIGSQKPKNFKHIVINNGAHDSVGGQPTAGFNIDVPSIVKACGYADVFTVETAGELKDKLKEMNSLNGPVLLEVRVNKGSRKDLGRPATTPLQNKKDFMDFLSK